MNRRRRHSSSLPSYNKNGRPVPKASMMFFLGILLSLLAWTARPVLATSHPQECLKFLALGDWGTTKVEATAQSMSKYAQPGSVDLLGCKAPVSSVLLLGDNFYHWGISGTDDPLVRDLYYHNFGVQAFPNISFSVIVGNHDHHGSVRSQLELTDADETHRWYLPRLFYSRTFEVGTLRVLFVFIDTWELVGGEAERDGNDQRIVDSQQLRWIKDVLRTEDVDFKVVVGHYAIRSARKGTPGLIKDLLPVLLENQVDAYVFGHDHIAQHIQRDGMNYLGSGLGGRTYDGPLETTVGLKYALTGSLGYMSFVFEESGMTVRVHAVKENGGGDSDQITYTTQIPSRKSLANQQAAEPARISLATKIRSSLIGD